MSHWWIVCGYHAFDAGKDGFPRPGQVVKYYRRLKLNEEGKPWTQKDLARVLGISEQALRDLENRDAGMDSYDRRRFLADLLNIPPVLLGIVSLEEILKGQEANKCMTTIQTVASTRKPARAVDMSEYQTSLLSYWEANHVFTARGAMMDIQARIDNLYRELPYTRREQKVQMMELLCGYHQFMANLLRDAQEYDASVVHLNKAYQLAKKLDKKELIALVLHRRGITLQEQGNIQDAVRDYGEARTYEAFLPANLVGSILLESGLVAAKDARSDKERRAALKFLERGGTIARTSERVEDPHFLKLNTDRYHLSKGSALIAMGWNNEAVDELSLVNCNPTQKRRQAYCDILQAQAYANLGMFPMAVSIAEDALLVVQEIKSCVNVARVEKIYRQLLTSSYKNNPEVARLGYLLRPH
jgi:transcriptional regulator with XRE-family HTH domain